MAWWNEWLNGFNNLDIEEKEPNFTESLSAKGFRYNETQNWYQRTWTTPLPEGVESCLEVYKKNEDDTWDAIMYGSSGDIFYEHNIGKKE